MGKSAVRTTRSEEGNNTWSSASTVGAAVVVFTGCPGVTYKPNGFIRNFFSFFFIKDLYYAHQEYNRQREKIKIRIEISISYLHEVFRAV